MEEPKKQPTTFDLIYERVRRIPRGKVASYGLVAAAAGNPRWARVVGYALHANPCPEEIPCHRVVTKAGAVAPGYAFGGAGVQRRRPAVSALPFLRTKKAVGVIFAPDGVGIYAIIFIRPTRHRRSCAFRPR